MKLRSLALIAGIAGIAYLVYRMSQGRGASQVIASSGVVKAPKVNVVEPYTPQDIPTIMSPALKRFVGDIVPEPPAGELGPPVLDSYWQGDLVADAHIASGLPDANPPEVSGTNVSVGVTSPFMKRPLEFLNAAS